MKKLFVALSLLLGFASLSPAYAGPSAAAVVADSESSNTTTKTQAIVYATGVLSGFFAIEGALLEKNKALVFCPPRDVSISPVNLIQWVKFAIVDKPATRDNTFELMALKVLEEKYPCR